MKKSQGFSIGSRPQTSKKQSPQQEALVEGMKKLSVNTKEFRSTSDENV